jgi:S-formylglutathione hydrolase FrmB
MIVVMPDANTGKRGYVNDIKGEWLYEDFFFQEFIPFVEKSLRIKSEKRYRAVAGLSMGGEGTFIYALHHPELFSSACPLSAATGPASLEELPKYRLWPAGENITAGAMEAYFNKYSVLKLIENMPQNQKNAVRWYIDCGDDDFLYEGNSLVHIAMRKKEIPHEFRIRDGGHTWTYWRESLPVVLQFVSMSFHQF